MAGACSDLAKYLDTVAWEECRAPRGSLPSPGSVECVIGDDYRITVHERKEWEFFRYAVVRYGEDKRYYRAGRGDYEDAVAILKSPGRIQAALEEKAPEEVTEEAVNWAQRPTLILDNVAYVDPYMPVSELPYGYQLAGMLSQAQAGTTNLEGREYYTNPNDPDRVYVFQECGAPIDINTVDTEKRQWAYKQWIKESLQAVESRRLTLDDVRMLSEKGEELTWEDFERYACVEGGSGLSIRIYQIDELFSLSIGGAGIQNPPMYIYLSANDGLEEKVDIRTEDVEAFVQAHKGNKAVTE